MGKSEQPPAMPPGWYEHPQMVNTMGYWDGQNWTGQFMPKQIENSGPSVGKIAAGVILGLVGFGILAGILYSCEQADRDQEYQDCLMDNLDDTLDGSGYQRDCEQYR